MQKLKKTIKKVAKMVKSAAKKPAPAKKLAAKPAKKAAPAKVAPKQAAKASAPKAPPPPAAKKKEAVKKPVAVAAPVAKAQKSVEKKPVEVKPKKAVAPKVAAPIEPEPTEPEEVVLTDAEGRRYCRTKECDQPGMVDGYCRYHYLLHWKKIQVRKKILTEGKLERYIDELTSRYPDKYIEILKKDLRTEKDFMAAIQELEIDENAGDGDFEEEAQTYLDEVRGVSSTSSGGDSESSRDDEF